MDGGCPEYGLFMDTALRKQNIITNLAAKLYVTYMVNQVRFKTVDHLADPTWLELVHKIQIVTVKLANWFFGHLSSILYMQIFTKCSG